MRCRRSGRRCVRRPWRSPAGRRRGRRRRRRRAFAAPSGGLARRLAPRRACRVADGAQRRASGRALRRDARVAASPGRLVAASLWYGPNRRSASAASSRLGAGPPDPRLWPVRSAQRPPLAAIARGRPVAALAADVDPGVRPDDPEPPVRHPARGAGLRTRSAPAPAPPGAPTATARALTARGSGRAALPVAPCLDRCRGPTLATGSAACCRWPAARRWRARAASFVGSGPRDPNPERGR